MQYVVTSTEPTGISQESVCRVTAGGYHPASPRHARTGLCDLHHEERARARSRWSSARSYHRSHPGSSNPGRWEDYEANIDWTPSTLR